MCSAAPIFTAVLIGVLGLAATAGLVGLGTLAVEGIQSIHDAKAFCLE